MMARKNGLKTIIIVIKLIINLLIDLIFYNFHSGISKKMCGRFYLLVTDRKEPGMKVRN